MAGKKRRSKRSLRGLGSWGHSGRMSRRLLGPCELSVRAGGKMDAKAQWQVLCRDRLVAKGAENFGSQAREKADAAAQNWIRSDAKKFASS